LSRKYLRGRNFGGKKFWRIIESAKLILKGPEKIKNLVGIYFGGLYKNSNLAEINFCGRPNNAFVWVKLFR